MSALKTTLPTSQPSFLSGLRFAGHLAAMLALAATLLICVLMPFGAAAMIYEANYGQVTREGFTREITYITDKYRDVNYFDIPQRHREIWLGSAIIRSDTAKLGLFGVIAALFWVMRLFDRRYPQRSKLVASSQTMGA